MVASLGVTLSDSALTISDANWKEISITIVRGDNPCVPNYEFWVPKEHADLFQKSLSESAALEIRTEALEAFRSGGFAKARACMERTISKHGRSNGPSAS